jgi:hypothetical protein
MRLDLSHYNQVLLDKSGHIFIPKEDSDEYWQIATMMLHTIIVVKSEQQDDFIQVRRAQKISLIELTLPNAETLVSVKSYCWKLSKESSQKSILLNFVVFLLDRIQHIIPGTPLL